LDIAVGKWQACLAATGLIETEGAPHVVYAVMIYEGPRRWWKRGAILRLLQIAWEVWIKVRGFVAGRVTSKW
jgi:hypothetical protein